MLVGRRPAPAPKVCLSEARSRGLAEDSRKALLDAATSDGGSKSPTPYRWRRKCDKSLPPMKSSVGPGVMLGSGFGGAVKQVEHSARTGIDCRVSVLRYLGLDSG